jgi:hypothetical protein
MHRLWLPKKQRSSTVKYGCSLRGDNHVLPVLPSTRCIFRERVRQDRTLDREWNLLPHQLFLQPHGRADSPIPKRSQESPAYPHDFNGRRLVIFWRCYLLGLLLIVFWFAHDRKEVQRASIPQKPAQVRCVWKLQGNTCTGDRHTTRYAFVLQSELHPCVPQGAAKRRVPTYLRVGGDPSGEQERLPHTCKGESCTLPFLW